MNILAIANSDMTFKQKVLVLRTSVLVLKNSMVLGLKNFRIIAFGIGIDPLSIGIVVFGIGICIAIPAAMNISSEELKVENG